MPENEIISEIRRHREEMARRFGYDIKKLMAFYREQQREREAAGVKYVSFAKRGVEGGSCVVREEPGDE